MHYRNWALIYLLILTIMWVVSAIVYGQFVGIIAASFPDIVRVVWYGGLFVGASVALVGTFMANVFGMMIERAALFIVSGLCLAFGAAFAAVAVAGHYPTINAVYAGPLVFAYGLVCTSRVLQITRMLRQYRDGLRRLGDTMASFPRVIEGGA